MCSSGSTTSLRSNAVTLIDTRAHGIPNHTACYLLQEGERAAFVDAGGPKSLPSLRFALEQRGIAPTHVDYVLLTHPSWATSGGLPALLEHCPNATLICHPHALESLQEQQQLRTPNGQNRIRLVKDGESVYLAGRERELRCVYTPGFGLGHMVVSDKASSSVMAGDAFGSCYAQHWRLLSSGESTPFLFPKIPEKGFDWEAAWHSIDNIVSLGAERAYLTHYGEWKNIQEGAKELHTTLYSLGKTLADIAKASNTIANTKRQRTRRTAPHKKQLEEADIVAWFEAKLLQLYARKFKQHGVPQPTHLPSLEAPPPSTADAEVPEYWQIFHTDLAQAVKGLQQQFSLSSAPDR
ncbi:MBL fold metallo-hydrolase [Balamuthia mandrillaris]